MFHSSYAEEPMLLPKSMCDLILIKHAIDVRPLIGKQWIFVRSPIYCVEKNTSHNALGPTFLNPYIIFLSEKKVLTFALFFTITHQGKEARRWRLSEEYSKKPSSPHPYSGCFGPSISRNFLLRLFHPSLSSLPSFLASFLPFFFDFLLWCNIATIVKQ